MTLGDIAGYSVGTTFVNWSDLNASKIHTPPQAGVSGGMQMGAKSIVMSGSYEDDSDHGDTIEYTAAGGHDRYKNQITDQEWGWCHKVLNMSLATKNPVRVIRGSKLQSRYAPTTG
ncbi:SRA-YDG [Pluteus cervinus]|uniref:SRA-YDG n=1 Tax=Pluteus cervinus TaxID=181527 RepID=A0ACD3B289_9AGAR|nr:SRA-YDG [Pluteus cervinus]